MQQFYRVIYAHDIEQLERYVISHYKDGWQCQGGVAVSVLKSEVTFYQAMVK